MRLAVLVAPDESPLRAEDEAWLRASFGRLGFRVVDSFAEITLGATLLVHVRGSTCHPEHLRVLSDAVAARHPENALFLAELTYTTDVGGNAALVAAERIEEVREALGLRPRGYAGLLAVRQNEGFEEPLAFTRLVQRIAEEAPDASAARLSEIAERVRSAPERHEVAQGYAQVRGGVDFELGWNEKPALAPLLALADGARERHEWEHANAGYRAALLVARDAPARATVYARIGTVERARGDLREARRAFEKGHEVAPDDPALLDALVAITAELGDWPCYVDLARRLVNVLTGRTEKADLLFAVARTLVQELRDLPAAVVALENARQLEPTRDDVLEALRRAYKVLQDWKRLLEITGVLADQGPSAAERSARRFAQARIALDKLGDEQLAIAFLDAALTEDPTNDEALDVLVEVRTTRGEVPQLGRALEELAQRYDEMGDAERAGDVRRSLASLPAGPPPPRLADVTGQLLAVPALPPTLTELPDLQELSPDSLEDDEEDGVASFDPGMEAAIDVPISFSTDETGVHSTPPSSHVESVPTEAAQEEPAPRASLLDELDALRATDLGGERPRALPVLPVVEEDDGSLLELEEAALRAPLDPSLHARLFGLHVRAGRIDRAYLSSLALEELGALRPEHVELLDQYRPDGALRPRALLDGPAWESMRAPGSDDVVEALFGAVAPAAIAAQISDRRARRRLVSLDPERKQAPASTVSIVASFRWAARVLGVDCPDLYVLDDVPGDIAAVPAAERSTALGPAVLTGHSTKDLAFLAARHLAYYRREYSVLVHFASLPELTLLVLACVQMELPAVPIPQSVAHTVTTLRTRIARGLSDADRTAMAAAVQRLESRGGRLDLASWVRSVELTAARAGLFLCGDLRAAMGQVRAGAVGAVTLDEARADLIAFATSRVHADLRAEYALVAPRASSVRSKGDMSSITPSSGENVARVG